MRPYELVVLLHPDLEIDVDAPIAKLQKLIERAGKVVKHDNWGKKRLAYRVSKQDYAVYVYFDLQLEPSKVRELENGIGLSEEVIRHILVAREAHKPTVHAKPKVAAAKSNEKVEEE